MSDLPTGGVPAADPDDEIPLDLEADDPPEDEELPEDDGEGEEQEDEGEPVAAAQPARRGSPRVQAFVNENRELKARLAVERAAFERQLSDLTLARNQPSPAEIAAAHEADRQRYEMMSPWEQAQYIAQTIDKRVTEQTTNIRIGLWDQNDKRAYDEELRTSPQFRRYDERVEELRKIAPGVSRIDLLDKAIGEYARTHGAAARTRAARGAEAGEARNGARASTPRGDVASQRGRGDGTSARDARLRAAGLIP